MPPCLFCPSSLQMYCQECKESYCHHCGISKHLREASIHFHTLASLCDQCKEQVSYASCSDCGRKLCVTCDARTHTSGIQAQHMREATTEYISMKDVKSICYMTLNFLRDYCMPGRLEEHLSHISRNIVEVQNDRNLKKILFVSVLGQGQPEVSQEELGNLENAFRKINIRNFVVLKAARNQDELFSFRQTVLKAMILNSHFTPEQDSTPEAYELSRILKNIKDLKGAYVFDTRRNETLVEILQAATNIQSENFFLNFEAGNPQPFEPSPYVSENTRDSFYSISKNPIRKQKLLSKPFLPSSILEPQSINSKLFNESSILQDVDQWNQSFSVKVEAKVFTEEPRLNATADQILQKRSLPFLNVQKQPQFVAAQGGSQKQNPCILMSQPIKNVELCGSVKLSHLFQQELRKFFSKGDLLIIKEEFVKKFSKSVQKKFNCKIDEVLKQAGEVKIIHTTIRKFLEIKPIFYIGTLLDTLTLESLIWILRSIKNDMMTPTEKLIISRIKECYGLKIGSNFWKSIINYILASQNMNQGNQKQANTFPLYASKILDPITNTDTFVIYLTHDEWVPEDQGTIDEESEEWKGFLAFIENFFREEEGCSEQRSTYSLKGWGLDSQDLGKKSTWSCSVENVLNKSTNKKDKSFKVSEDMKAIPGGRYGCAQFIKVCGPELLSKLSIGRLTLFVQEAIKRGILKYQSTLLVKNHPNDSMGSLPDMNGTNTSFSQDPVAERKASMIKNIKDVLLEVLTENPEGIPLAQIPLHLKRKMSFVVNFQDLGFPKLKNFLVTLQDFVKIESSGTNHAIVKLQNPLPAGTRKNNTFLDQSLQAECLDSTRNSLNLSLNQSQVFQRNLSSKNLISQDQAGFDSLKYNVTTKSDTTLTSSSTHRNAQAAGKDTSLLDDYLNKVRGFIELILSDNCYGIALEKLNKRLNGKLNCELDVGLFNCKDFYEFLMTHAESLLDIEVKKSCSIVYPKSFKSGSQAPTNLLNNLQQRAAMKSSDYFETSSNNLLNYIKNRTSHNTSAFQLHKSLVDPEMPPGLAKPVSNHVPPAFSLSFKNQPLSTASFSQAYVGNGLMENKENIQNLSNISCTMKFYKDEGNRPKGLRNVQKHVPNEDYWLENSLVGYGNVQEGGRQEVSYNNSQINSSNDFHSRSDITGITMQNQEESNVEIMENLKFIEELLKDNDPSEGSMMITGSILDQTNVGSRFGRFPEANLSLMGPAGIKPRSQQVAAATVATNSNYLKTSSENFYNNKNALNFSSCYGRVLQHNY